MVIYIRTRRIYKTASYTIYKQSYHLIYRAKCRFGVYPLHHSWQLNGHILEGKGKLKINGTTVKFKAYGQWCELWTELGSSLRTNLTLVSVDAHGRQITSSVPVNIDGKIKEGGRPDTEKQAAQLALLVRLGAEMCKKPIEQQNPGVPILRNAQIELINALKTKKRKKS